MKIIKLHTEFSSLGNKTFSCRHFVYERERELFLSLSADREARNIQSGLSPSAESVVYPGHQTVSMANLDPGFLIPDQ